MVAKPLHIWAVCVFVNSFAALVISAATVTALGACTGEESSGADTVRTTANSQTNVPAESSTTTPTALGSPATVESSASAAFCATASRAVDGQFDFSSDERIAELNDDPSLSPEQRAIVSHATADAKRQVASGSWSNDLLVEAVNEICGTNFTPVTMTQ